MKEFEIRKKCKTCGLEYWEDGRVNNHFCLSPEVKEEQKQTEKSCKGKLVELLINKSGGFASTMNIRRGVWQEYAEFIYQFIETEIVPDMVQEHMRKIVPQEAEGWDNCIATIKENIRKAKSGE